MDFFTNVIRACMYVTDTCANPLKNTHNNLVKAYVIQDRNRLHDSDNINGEKPIFNWYTCIKIDIE